MGEKVIFNFQGITRARQIMKITGCESFVTFDHTNHMFLPIQDNIQKYCHIEKLSLTSILKTLYYTGLCKMIGMMGKHIIMRVVWI